MKALLLIFFSFCLLCSQSNKNRLSDFNKNLTNLRKEINSIEQDLKSKSSQQKASAKDLEKISKQTLLLNKLVNQLKAEEKNAEEQIEDLNIKIFRLGKNINELKDEYSNYIRWIYKNNLKNEYNYIINSNSVRQAIYRMKYMNSISEYNSKKVENMLSNLFNYTALTRQYEDEKSRKEALVNQKLLEQFELEKKRKEKQNLISLLKRDQNNLLRQLTEKKKNENEIRNLISRLIEKDSKASTITKATKNSNTKIMGNISTKNNYTNLNSFEALSGKMNWPVNNGKVYRPFGQNKNDKLNTVTQNNGIDIQTNQNADVFSVADGFVSTISWISGYGSVIILTHRDNYRTVYANIGEINVNEGQKISAGTKLGKVQNSLEGNILHFEIWNERNYQNPNIWLK